MSGKDTADQHLPLLCSTGTNEQVSSMVADPEQLQAARRRLPIVAFDQTPVWLKLRAEDRVMLAIPDVQQSSLRCSLSDKSKQPGLSPADREQASAEMQLWCQRNPDLQQESHHKISQGGDKHRLTLVTFQMVHNWFDPDCEPRGSIPASLLIVPCAKHCRLEDIDQDGKWNKDVTYQVGDETETFQQGQPSQGLLSTWRATRDQADPEIQHMFQQIRVWGQPSGWTDEVITTWMSSYVKRELAPDGCLQIVDCLGSQWSEVTLSHTWANQQMQVPIAPNATSCLQIADTHIHSPLKAYIRQAKSELQTI